jgi:hypothetical protein
MFLKIVGQLKILWILPHLKSRDFRIPGFGILFKNFNSEPEFLKILKCNSAESVSAGFPFTCFDIFNDKLLIIGI